MTEQGEQQFTALAVGSDDREVALTLAVQVYTSGRYSGGTGEIVHMAGTFYGFLTAPVRLTVTPDPMTYDQGSPEGPGTPTRMEGTTVQITDEEQYTATVAETDSKGQPVTGDTLAWTIDNPAVASITPSADGYSALITGLTDGTANYTVTDSTANPPLTGTGSVTVISSAATSLVISEGTAEPQTPAASAAPAAPSA